MRSVGKCSLFYETTDPADRNRQGFLAVSPPPFCQRAKSSFNCYITNRRSSPSLSRFHGPFLRHFGVAPSCKHPAAVEQESLSLSPRRESVFSSQQMSLELTLPEGHSGVCTSHVPALSAPVPRPEFEKYKPPL